MVNHDLWEKFGAGKNHLCLSCFEIRLGRAISKEDFTVCLANEYNKVIHEIMRESSCKYDCLVKPNI